MPVFLFRCPACGTEDDVHVSFDEGVPEPKPCPGLDCWGNLERVWTSVAIGAGSSGGTPPRGHQRFVKGDAGWTNG